MSEEVFSVDELLSMNVMMLGRGMPTQDDGMGYNKADYGACSKYYDGLSDAQVADLAKRLVKYSNTQLDVDKELMKETAKHYQSLVECDADRRDGISISITDEGTLISFSYNEKFVEVIKAQPVRKYDANTKQWIVPNDRVIPVLNALWTAGADVSNALKYASNHKLIQKAIENKTEILTTFGENEVYIKFDYNKDIVAEIKKIDKSARKWNPQHKYWAINNSQFKPLMKALNSIASFKAIKQG